VMENFAPEALVVAIADECVDRVASSPYRAAWCWWDAASASLAHTVAGAA